MSFASLYDAVQHHQGRISSKWLKERAIELSHITAVKEMWSAALDDSAVRGFYIEGPMGPPVPLADNEALIVLSRGMCARPAVGTHWRRFVYTKELMHVFDEEDEKANTPQTFDIQIEKFGDPSVGMSPQFRAEQKAFWRACSCLCQEEQRLEYKRQLEASEISIDVLSATMRLPAVFVREMMRDDLGTIIQQLL